MSKVAIEGNALGSGTFTIASPNTNSSYTLSLPENTGTIITTGSTFAGTGPAFSAYNTSSQSISNNTFTKVTLQTEVFDTNSCFDNSTNYRFTPNVAGYYQINAVVRVTGTSLTGGIAAVYKNGSVYSYGQAFDGVTTTSANVIYSEVIYFNGTTDYVELYGYITATSPSFGYVNGSINCRFSGALVRAA